MEKCINVYACTGCTACRGICPNNAISMHINSEGFIVSMVDADKCTGCSLCKSVCPIENGIINKDTTPQMYASYSKDASLREISTSGGIFFNIAKYFIEKNNATVFGATMDENMNVKHIGIKKVEELACIMGSKYVQSDMNDCFFEAKKLLDNGEWVLFSGVGCQINGLKRYLKKKYEHLFTVDLICHGIPSHTMFVDYVRYLEKKFEKKICEYKFRQKRAGLIGPSYDTKILFSDKTLHIISGDDDIYTLNYLRNNLQNTACFSCPFTSVHRDGDITLGDYWGIEWAHPEISKVNGVSLILINSLCGKKVIDDLSDSLEIIETYDDKVKIANRQLYEPTKKGKRWDIIYSKYENGKFSYGFYHKCFIGKEMSIYLLKRKILKTVKKMKKIH